MSAEDMRDIAEYFALQKEPRTTFRADPAKAAQGKARAEQLECASCHQADYFGKDSSPRLAGQWADYLRVASTVTIQNADVRRDVCYSRGASVSESAKCRCMHRPRVSSHRPARV